MYSLLILSCLLVFIDSVIIDPYGYLMFCPCMGRFGNQADQFLGALAFAKALDRTLVLPPWVEYHYPKPRSVQVPFRNYFKVEAINEYHRAISMKHFMEEIADEVWPRGERIAFCYSPRTSPDSKKASCAAKEGNPFESFWDTYDIDFDKSAYYGPLDFDVMNIHNIQKWYKKFPPEKYPVLAFTGTPGSFPVAEANVGLHRYLQWSDKMLSKMLKFRNKSELGKDYISIHLRLGSDFKNACDHLKSSPSMFAAPQCFGYRGEHGKGTMEMCYPSDDTIVKQVKRTLKKTGLKKVFIGSDSRDLVDKMSKEMPDVKFVRSKEDNPHLDLMVMARGKHFIGNCFSTFSAFVKRERDVNNLPSEFWAFKQKPDHDEF